MPWYVRGIPITFWDMSYSSAGKRARKLSWPRYYFLKLYLQVLLHTLFDFHTPSFLKKHSNMTRSLNPFFLQFLSSSTLNKFFHGGGIGSNESQKSAFINTKIWLWWLVQKRSYNFAKLMSQVTSHKMWPAKRICFRRRSFWRGRKIIILVQHSSN